MSDQPDFKVQFEALLSKYAELLTGQDTAETIDKVKIWALYNHINKTMPALTAHWNSAHPEVRPIMKGIFEEIKALNAAKSANANPSESLPVQQPPGDSGQ